MSGYTLNPVCRSHGLPLTKLNTATQTYHCVIMGCKAWVAREMYDPEKEGEMPESKDALERDLDLLREAAAEPGDADIVSTVGATSRVLLMVAEDRLHPVRTVDVEDDTDPGPEYYREQYRLRDVCHGTTTRFMDDLEQMFVTEDVGGDMNFIIDPDEGTPPGFASLSPAEVVRLHAVLTERIKSYPQAGITP